MNWVKLTNIHDQCIEMNIMHFWRLSINHLINYSFLSFTPSKPVAFNYGRLVLRKLLQKFWSHLLVNIIASIERKLWLQGGNGSFLSCLPSLNIICCFFAFTEMDKLARNYVFFSVFQSMFWKMAPLTWTAPFEYFLTASFSQIKKTVFK